VTLDLPTFMALAAACAPQIAPQTLLALARVESGLDPLAIGVNGAGGRALRPADRNAATAQATALIGAGRNIDLGLAQINSRNLGKLGLSVAEAFDPCLNLSASARVLQTSYRLAAPLAGAEQARLRMALSFYNTGGATRGLANGFVAKVVAAAGQRPSDATQPSAPRTDDEAPPPTWDVFARARWAGAARVSVFPANPANPGAEP
jgi:type IV secretion system protein VirB1